MKTAVHISSLPQSALQYDLNSLYGVYTNNFIQTKLLPQILSEVRKNITVDPQTLKDERISKLNSMADWELDEIEREKEYAERIKQTDSSNK